jgi:flagellar biosynthetic protein FlhB
MSENQGSNEDRTEEATPERRDEFREKGQIAISRDLASTVSLGVLIAALWQVGDSIFKGIMSYASRIWRFEKNYLPDMANIGLIMTQFNYSILASLIPVLTMVSLAAIFAVLAQTRFNFSWQRLGFDWNRLNPVSGFSRMISMQSLVELIKSILKLCVVALITYLVLHSAWKNLPLLMMMPLQKTLGYWGDLTKDLFYSVIGLLLTIAVGDYFYQFMTLEKQLMMTKEEVKQEYKQREQDPHIKQRMKRMQRDNITRSKIARTKTATVIVTNPTHYSIALKYELNYSAPILVAKGVDEVALRMRLVAKDEKIPIVENRSLARSLYAQVEEGEEIPSKFYAAVAEVIRYVYKVKGKKIRKKVIS